MGLLREDLPLLQVLRKRRFNWRLVAREKGVVMRTLGYDVYSSHSHLRGNNSITTLDIICIKWVKLCQFINAIYKLHRIFCYILAHVNSSSRCQPMAVNTSVSGSTQLEHSCRLLFLHSPANISASLQLWDENTPGASLNGCDPSELYVVELKHW